MQIVVKPAGLVVILMALVALSLIAFSRRRPGQDTAPSSTVASATASKPSESSVASGSDNVKATTISLKDSQSDSSRAIAPGHTQEQQMLASPATASDSWTVISSDGGVADIHVYPNADAAPGTALAKFPSLRRIQITKIPTNPWSLQLRQSTSGKPIAVGMHMRARMWARSKDNCLITVACEHNTDPYEKLASREFTLTPEWQEYDMDWTADRSVAGNWAQISLQLGAKPGQIELAGASLTASAVKS